jgi:hypothetical protein
MKKCIIILLYFVVQYSSAQQNINFDYKLLAKDTISYKIMPKLGEQIIKIGNDKLAKKQYIYNLDTLQKIAIVVYNNKYSPEGEFSTNRDYIKIKNNKYIVDKLYYGESYLKNDPLALGFRCYKFNFLERNFISFFFTIANYSSANQNTFVVLFDVTNIENPKLLLTSFQEAYTPLCFGDFNNDGLLDFFAKSRVQNYNSCYYFENDKKKLHKNIKLYIVGSPFSPKIIPAKSKWFFDLSKK